MTYTRVLYLVCTIVANFDKKKGKINKELASGHRTTEKGNVTGSLDEHLSYSGFQSLNIKVIFYLLNHMYAVRILSSWLTDE